MKTKIEITGQIGGNFTLLRSLPDAEEVKKLNFNSFSLLYNTKKDAKNALKKAFEKLADEEPEMVDKIGGIEFYDDSLYYDASKASII